MSSNPLLKSFSLALLTLQATALPLIVRYTRIRPAKDLFYPTTAVFFTELLKLIAVLIIISFQEKRRCWSSIYDAIIKQPMETLKVFIPSLLYTLQNNLYYVGLSNLDAATFAVTYQLKIIATAIFAVLLLRKPLSCMQWVSLFLLAGGVALVQLQEQLQTAAVPPPVASQAIVQKSNLAASTQHPMIGLMAVIAVCLTSGFAGIFYEKILKSSSVSVWHQNVRLALLGVPMSLVAVVSKDLGNVQRDGLLHGYDPWVWSIIFLNGLGGLTIAVVMKYADNILKSYAQSVAIVAACVGSGLIFGFVPTSAFAMGATLVVVSVILYAKFPPKMTAVNATVIHTEAHVIPVESLLSASQQKFSG